jgi:hypothetical protein
VGFVWRACGNIPDRDRAGANRKAPLKRSSNGAPSSFGKTRLSEPFYVSTRKTAFSFSYGTAVGSAREATRGVATCSGG